MSLHEEAERYRKLSGDYNPKTPISRIGGYLDGYERAMQEFTADPDTVSRQAVLENVCTMLRNCFDASDEMIESVKITVGELSPSPTPCRQAEQPEQEYDVCDDCDFTEKCTYESNCPREAIWKAVHEGGAV